MIYLNNAATSYPKPEVVAEAVKKALTSPPGSAGRGGMEQFDVFDAVRRRLAVLMGTSYHDGIALGANATWGLNIGIFGFPFVGGDVVLTTRAEHNSVLRPLYELEQKNVIKVVYLDVDRTGRMQPEIWEQALTEYRPALCIFTHASNVTGAVNDAETLCDLAHKYGASVLVDVSQTLGWIPVEAEKWGLDMVCFTGHKYLLGPQGTGGIWVREGLRLHPHMLGGTGVYSDRDTMPEDMPTHLEAGTGNEPSYHGLLAALRWVEEHPEDRSDVDAKVNRIRTCLRELGAKVIIPEGEATPVISFCFPGTPVSETGFMLEDGADIICRTGLHCAPKIFSCLGLDETVRLSLSRFTTDVEVDELVDTLQAICG